MPATSAGMTAERRFHLIGKRCKGEKEDLSDDQKNKICKLIEGLEAEG
jgi:hypothetical protein